MAVLGRVLLSSAERIDLPDLLSIDSYVAGDFKFLLKGLVGDNKPFVLKGFDVIDPLNAIGTQSCSIKVADSVVFYPGSKSGSFFHGLQEGHPQAAPLVPELRKNATNFVYLTFSTFNTSVDTRAFWDPDKDGGAGGEFTQDVNTESVLKVDINVSTGSFPANTIPIAKIVVGPVVITSITDCRDMLFRLGSGGISPDPFSNYEFRSLPSSTYKRTEPPTTMSAGGVNPFQGGDKNLHTLKEWMDLVMTKFKELSGTTYWYEDLSSYSLISGFVDALATTFKSKGSWQHSSVTPGLITWTQDIQIKVTQDPRDVIIRAGSKTLANEEVAYLSLVRNQPINISDSPVAWTNGQAYVNTVGGATGYFANLAKGDWIKKANDPNHLFLRVEEFYDSVSLGGSTTTAASARSIRLSAAYQGTTLEEKARYDKGVYAFTDVAVAPRNSSALTTAGGNFHWMALRSDIIENLSSLTTVSLSGTLSAPDGSKAKITSTAHGLEDGDRVTLTAPVAQAGTYVIEKESANVFYINTTDMTTGAVTAFYGLGTTAARDNGYGLQLESATHEFDSGDTIAIAGTTNYNDSYVVNVRSATTFQFAVPASQSAETAGTATLARVNVRSEQGVIKVVQGGSASIGDGVTDNLKSFVGMNSDAEDHPVYLTPDGYNALDGMANYGSLSNDSLTARTSKLTAMMADKAQDKTIKYLPSANLTTITNTTNGAAQEITFDTGSTLTIITPGSDGQATIALPDITPGISLLINQAAYVVIDRDNPTSPTIVVADISEVPISENVFVIATRLSTVDVYIWEGSIVNAGSVPTPGFLDDVVRQNQMMKLVEGGLWSWNLGTETLTWSAAAAMQIPGLANSVNNIAAGNIVLTAGQVAYVDINRSGVGGTIAVTAASNATLPLLTNRMIIARREGTDVIVGNHSMRLISGESKKLYAATSVETLAYIGSPNAADAAADYNGANTHVLRYLTEGSSLTAGISTLDDQLDKLFGQLRIRAKDPISKRVIVTGAERIVLDNTTLSQQLKNTILKFDGAEIDLETGDVYESDGTTPLGFNFTPATIAANQYRWYSITLVPTTIGLDNRISAKIQIIAGTSDAATSDAAPRAQFASGGLKLGQVFVQNSGVVGVINNVAQANCMQLGIGSGGSGSDTEPGSVYEEKVFVTASPSGNNEMAALPSPPTSILMPKDTNKLVGTQVLASTDGSTATVTILKINHGLTTGDLVTVTTATAIGGISALNLSVVNATVTVVDTNTFTYVATASSSSVDTNYLDRVIATTTRYYSVGDGSLEIFLNGIFLNKGEDYTEVGAPGVQSNFVSFEIPLVIDDLITYRIDANVGQQIINASGGGGGEANTASNVGGGAGVFKQKILADLEFRSITTISGISATQTSNNIVLAAKLNTQTVAVDSTLSAANDLTLVDATSGPIVISLPAAASVPGKVYNVKKIDSSANTVTIDPNASETIDGVSTKSTTIQYENLTFVSDGTQWWLI